MAMTNMCKKKLLKGEPAIGAWLSMGSPIAAEIMANAGYDAVILDHEHGPGYSSHHSSMHALVQIVNCYDRLGETRDADIAHHNALIRLRQLPDGAFRDPQSMMDRAAWERWLRDRPVGATAAAAGTVEVKNSLQP